MEENLLHELVTTVFAKKLRVLNVVVRQHGEILARHDFAPEQPVLLYSASKTFASMAIGIAQAEGLLSVDDLLRDYFRPTGVIPAHIDEIRIRHLLSMSAGHAADPVTTAMDNGAPLDDIEALFFAEPFVTTPGTRFKYDNSCTYMLSKLITLRSGQNLRDYLMPRLFTPLGIDTPHWESDPSGIAFGCSGLHLDATDLSKFGQLLLDHGDWKGQQLIPAEYISGATRQQISTADFNEPFATPDYRSGYGFQIWMNHIPGTYRVDGFKGQYIIVLPEQDALVTFISDEPKRMTRIIDLVWETLLSKL
jgi:CubicO group peptidase (beta-lactamase class C family)